MKVVSCSEIAKLCDRVGPAVVACTPSGVKNTRRIYDHLDYADGSPIAANTADAMAIQTDWNRCRIFYPAQLRDMMNNPIFVDLRNVYTREQIEKRGLRYAGIGRS